MGNLRTSAAAECCSREIGPLGAQLMYHKHRTKTCAGMCAQVLRQFMLLPEGEVRELESLATRVVTAEAEKAAEEELLQDPPEEFVDALMDTLMEDPVILPTSKQVIDRTTISRRVPSVCHCV